MIAWKVAPALAAGCSVVLLPSPRGTLVLGRRSSGWPRRPASRPACSTWSRAAPTSVSGSCLAPGRRHGDVHRVQRDRRGRDEGGRADEQEGRARARRQVADRGPARAPTSTARSGRRCCGSVATPVRAAARRRGSWCTATSTTRSSAKAVAFIDEQVPTGDPTRRGDRGRSADHAPSTATAWRATSRGPSAGGARIAHRRRPPRRARRFFLEPDPGRRRRRRTTRSARTSCSPPSRRCMAYDTVDEAVAIANNSRYGLNALVWGDRRGGAGRWPAASRRGTVAINGGGGSRPDVPWVGVKQSGVGMEMGEDGFAEFFTVKHLQWAAGVTPRPPAAPRTRRRLAGRDAGPRRDPDRPFLMWVPVEAGRRRGPGREFAARRRPRWRPRSPRAGCRPRRPRRAGPAQLARRSCVAWSAVASMGAVAVCLNPRRRRRPRLRRRAQRLASRDRLRPDRCDRRAWRCRAPTSSSSLDLGRARHTLRPCSLPTRSRTRGRSRTARPGVSIQYTSGHDRAAQGRRVDARPTACGPARSARPTRASAPTDVNLVHLPLFHTNALSYSFLSSLWSGGQVVLVAEVLGVAGSGTSRSGTRATWTSVVSFCVRALATREVAGATRLPGLGQQRGPRGRAADRAACRSSAGSG